jgi:secreted PhoX family phosphatase
MIDRRGMLKGTAAAGLGLASTGLLGGIRVALPAEAATNGANGLGGHHGGRLGPLVPDPDGVLDLPRGFEYQVVTRAGDPLAGQASGITPGRPDGTAPFPGKWGRVHLVTNHEQGSSAPFPVVSGPDLTYDPGALGGTTTLLLDRDGSLVSQYVSLAGTFNNCAGGAMPWGVWLTCEETEQKAGGAFTRDHGWVFEVSPYHPEANRRPEPLTGLGRFAHEAVVADPVRGHLYLTEDASSPNGLLYRFTPRRRPNALHSLRRGGTLEAMSVPGVADLSVYSRLGTRLPVDWKAVPDPSAATVSTRKQFTDSQVTRSRKFEGAWWGGGKAYIVCSYARLDDGSAAEHDGQVWSYDPRRSRLELEAHFARNPDPSPGGAGQDTVDGPDNITVNPYGGLVVAEDGEGTQHLVAVVDGVPSLLARNVLSTSELTGVSFSPDRRTLYANIQDEGYTFAITGPFSRTGGRR